MNEKNEIKVGRHSEYKEEYIARVDEYLAKNQDTFGIVNDKIKLIVKLPTIAGFAQFLNISKKTLYNWAKLHPELLHTLETKIKYKQKIHLINYGLSGDYNSNIVKLLLVSNHDMTDKGK